MAQTDLIAQARLLADIIVYIWIVSIAIAVLMGKTLNRSGVTFRTFPGIWSPPVTEAIQPIRQPLEHAELFLLLGGLLLLRGSRDLIIVTLIGLLIDCLSGMLFPRAIRHFRSTNLLFSYLGFLLLRGYFEVTLLSTLVTILVGCLGGKLLWEMIPTAGNPIWKIHLLNFVGGALTARGIDAIATLFPTSQFW